MCAERVLVCVCVCGGGGGSKVGSRSSQGPEEVGDGGAGSPKGKGHPERRVGRVSRGKGASREKEG